MNRPRNCAACQVDLCDQCYDGQPYEQRPDKPIECDCASKNHGRPLTHSTKEKA